MHISYILFEKRTPIEYEFLAAPKDPAEARGVPCSGDERMEYELYKVFTCAFPSVIEA